MEWILPCNPEYYDIDGALQELRVIDWFTNCHIEKGDTCYIYISHTEKAIFYKCEAVSDIKNESTIDDSGYGGNKPGVEKKCVEIELQDIYSSPGITYYELCEVGLKGSIRSPMKVEGELAEYIHEWEAAETEIIDEEVPPEYADEEGYDVSSIVGRRVGQTLFRKKLLEKYDCCCICGIKNKGLLTASHIKPWAVADGAERVDIDNGFIMCPNHDKLFDKGLISFDDSGKVIVSSELSQEDAEKMGIDGKVRLNHLSQGNKRYLDYHRKEVFIP
ncbi:MAG: HNH endonuclease [Butyrivibrio sp.]|nr:HNH endonuclease [Butyrivibrio sp.]